MEFIKSNEVSLDFAINFGALSQTQKSVLSKIVTNKRQFDDISKSFWTDMFLNMSNRQFEKLSENLKGMEQNCVKMVRV